MSDLSKIDTTALDDIVEWMNSRGVRRLRLDDIELEIDLDHHLRGLPDDDADKAIGED